MKKFLLLFILILCVALLASCNMQEQIGQMSDKIKDQIIDMAGKFIEKNTDSSPIVDEPSDTPNEPDEPSVPDVPSEPDVPDVPSEPDEPVIPDVPSEPDVPDVPDIPHEPVIPEVPDYILLEREKYPLNKYIGLTITKEYGVNLTNEDYKYKSVYGHGRLEIALDEALKANPITYFSISGMESSALLDFDLSQEYVISDIAAKVHEFANKYCLSTNALSNLRRIEIGTNPDTKISAKDYALLLNTIYDDNCMQNENKVGTTFINPEIRLITGKMSLNLPYIQELMNEIKLLRNDEFLPIGGWSFSVSTEGKRPEDAFLGNDALKELISYRNENYNSIEIHISDFGWDTVNTESSSFVAPSDDYTSEEIQAMYILRSFLILQGMDVDKASYDMINDTTENGHGIIAADGTKKLSYSLLEYFKTKMNGMFLSEIVSNGENDCYCYKLENGEGKTIYAVWSSSGLKSYTIRNLPENVTLSTYDKAAKEYTDTEITTQGLITKVINESIMFLEYTNN